MISEAETFMRRICALEKKYLQDLDTKRELLLGRLVFDCATLLCRTGHFTELNAFLGTPAQELSLRTHNRGGSHG